MQNIETTKQWFSSFNNSSLNYRVLTELYDYKKDDAKIKELKNKIPDNEPVKKLLSKMHPDGYWLQKQYNGKIVGEGVEYGSFASTHFCLAYLAELGLDHQHPLIAKAADRYLNLVQPDGDWFLHMSCLNGYNIRNFIMLGYRDDPRLQKVINLMLETKRIDDGYLCDMHEKYGKRKKSCIRGSGKMLLALACLPEYYNHPRTIQLINYFLNRNGIFRSSDLTTYANKDIEVFSFPLTWGTNAWEILLALSMMGYGKNEKLRDAWKLIDNRKNKDGTYHLDFTPNQLPIKFGKRGEADPWLTFYILLAKKFAGLS